MRNSLTSPSSSAMTGWASRTIVASNHATGGLAATAEQLSGPTRRVDEAACPRMKRHRTRGV
jgi:hypothetical protein